METLVIYRGRFSLRVRRMADGVTWDWAVVRGVAVHARGFSYAPLEAERAGIEALIRIAGEDAEPVEVRRAAI